MDAYIEGFRKTPLVMLLTDAKTNGYALAKRDVGWRVDCLGDMGGFGNGQWSHMLDYYPQAIINYGMADAWKKAPVSLEVCWVMQHWKNKGWDVDYIIDQSLKWHISSFNGKSSAVPEEWKPQVERWLKKMGYRFVLRKFTYPAAVAPSGKLAYTSWWENKGVAPCYRRFPLALRLKNAARTEVMLTEADIRGWLPGDNLHDGAVFVPAGNAGGRVRTGGRAGGCRDARAESEAGDRGDDGGRVVRDGKDSGGQMTPADIAKFFDGDCFAAGNGIRVTEVRPGFARAEMTVEARHLNAVGILQGGRAVHARGSCLRRRLELARRPCGRVPGGCHLFQGGAVGEADGDGGGNFADAAAVDLSH